jgi:hypothetical protein
MGLKAVSRLTVALMFPCGSLVVAAQVVFESKFRKQIITF